MLALSFFYKDWEFGKEQIQRAMQGQKSARVPAASPCQGPALSPSIFTTPLTTVAAAVS